MSIAAAIQRQPPWLRWRFCSKQKSLLAAKKVPHGNQLQYLLSPGIELMVPNMGEGNHKLQLRLKLGTTGPCQGYHQLNQRFWYTGNRSKICFIIVRAGPYMGLLSNSTGKHLWLVVPNWSIFCQALVAFLLATFPWLMLHILLVVLYRGNIVVCQASCFENIVLLYSHILALMHPPIFPHNFIWVLWSNKNWYTYLKDIWPGPACFRWNKTEPRKPRYKMWTQRGRRGHKKGFWWRHNTSQWVSH